MDWKLKALNHCISTKNQNKNRPFIHSVNYHTSKMPEHVDFHHQLIVKEVPSYVTHNAICFS